MDFDNLDPDQEPSDWRSKSFKYQALETADTIRILVVHPASTFLDPLVAELIHAPRRYNIGQQTYLIFQDYTAVSYHWGPPEFASRICCNDSTIRVTLHVEYMLRRLRRTTEPRRLWVDAICLNQSDAAEKSIQIQKMRQIYEEAKKVIIWLGEPTPTPYGNRLEGPSQAQNARARGVALNVVASLRYLKIIGEIPDDTLGRSLDTFLNNPWFKRRWIVQEATAHGHTIILFGNQKIAWPELALCIDRLRLDKAILSTQDAVERIRKLKSPPTNLLDAIVTYRAFECGDTRDFIAALRGLAKFDTDDTLQSWKVNYQDSWAQNFTSFARAAILAGHSAKIWDHLEEFGALEVFDDESVPCWVPNWTSMAHHARGWKPDRHNISLHPTFDARHAVRVHLVNSINKPLPGLDLLLAPFGYEDLKKAIDGPWDSVTLPKRVYEFTGRETDLSIAIETLFKSLTQDVVWSSMELQDLQTLLMEVLPMREISRKYVYRPAHDSHAIERFQLLISTWLIAMTFGGGQLRLYRTIELRRNSVYHPLDPSNTPHTRGLGELDYELDLLDWAIINDCLYPALQELLKDHVFFLTPVCVGVMRRSVSLQQRFLISEKPKDLDLTISRVCESVSESNLSGSLQESGPLRMVDVQAMAVWRVSRLGTGETRDQHKHWC